LIFRITGIPRIDRTSPDSFLNTGGDLWTVRVTMVHQQFPGPEPGRIQIRKIAARPIEARILNLFRAQENETVETVHERRQQHSNQQRGPLFGSTILQVASTAWFSSSLFLALPGTN
jgi:hypothetical protein